MSPTETLDPTTTRNDLQLMQRVALTRLRRFERIAVVADESGSPLWRRLAAHAAAAALRDCLLLGLDPKIDDAGAAEAA
jgi:hypothetical protein